MKFDVFGKSENPVIVMLAGSFCAGEGLKYVYSQLCGDYCVIAPTYNGVHKGSCDFTTRQNEAKEIADFIVNENIETVKMIYGQSMGSEIGAELIKQLIERGIKVENAFFDGAPMVKLSKVYKAFMLLKFSSMIKLAKKKTADEVLNMGFIKKLGGGKTSSLRPMLEDMAKVVPYISKQTIKNQVECCYTFDFPEFSEETQSRMYFCYGTDEKAYKACYKGVKKAYPNANYIFKNGHGHLTYSIENTDEYVEMLKDICR